MLIYIIGGVIVFLVVLVVGNYLYEEHKIRVKIEGCKRRARRYSDGSKEYSSTYIYTYSDKTIERYKLIFKSAFGSGGDFYNIKTGKTDYFSFSSLKEIPKFSKLVIGGEIL